MPIELKDRTIGEKLKILHPLLEFCTEEKALPKIIELINTASRICNLKECKENCRTCSIKNYIEATSLLKQAKEIAVLSGNVPEFKQVAKNNEFNVVEYSVLKRPSENELEKMDKAGSYDATIGYYYLGDGLVLINPRILEDKRASFENYIRKSKAFIAKNFQKIMIAFIAIALLAHMIEDLMLFAK